MTGLAIAVHGDKYAAHDGDVGRLCGVVSRSLPEHRYIDAVASRLREKLTAARPAVNKDLARADQILPILFIDVRSLSFFVITPRGI